MKILRSWSLYVIIFIVGIGFIFIPSQVLDQTKEPKLKYRDKSILRSPAASPRLIYEEMKFWGETVGKIMGGVGGVGLGVKAVVEIFKKKKKRR